MSTQYPDHGDLQQEIIEDRFELREVLGEGAQGITYRGWDRVGQQVVAIKELRLGSAQSWKVMELFEREARVLRQLDHPGIPDYIAAVNLEGEAGQDVRFLLVQEFVEGQDFGALVDQGLSMTEQQARAFLKELLDILVYLQQRSPPVIHRDIKPSNIMRRRDGRLALIDFGAVQAVLPDERGGSTVVGTTGYMPIEQLMGRAGAATDIYSLGVTVVHLLSGRHPSQLPLDDLRLEFEEAIRVSPEFQGYLAKMLEPRANRRFASAQQALQALNDLDKTATADAMASSGESLRTSTPTPTPTPSAAVMVANGLLWLVQGLVAAIMALVGLIYVTSLISPSEQEVVPGGYRLIVAIAYPLLSAVLMGGGLLRTRLPVVPLSALILLAFLVHWLYYAALLQIHASPGLTYFLIICLVIVGAGRFVVGHRGELLLR